MILSSSEILSKRVYPQTQLSFALETERMKDCSISFIGPSGYSGQFLFAYDKIIAPTGKFIGCYLNDENFKFQVNFDTPNYSVFINDDLHLSSHSWAYTGAGNPRITGIILRNLYTGDFEVNSFLYGSRPAITFSPLVTTDLLNYTGTWSIEEGSQLYDISPEFMVYNSGIGGIASSGNYVLQGSGLGSGHYEKIDFSFDFGIINASIPIYYQQEYSYTGYLNVANENTASGVYIDETGTWRHYSYNNFSVSSLWNAETHFNISLEYLGRSGQQVVPGTGVGTGNYSGFINGSGYVRSNRLTGTIFPIEGNSSQFNPVIGVGTGAKYVYTTGPISYDYAINVVGYESGVAATGVLMGTLSGYVNDGSGHYHFNTNVVGTPWISVWNGGIFTSPTGNYTGSVDTIAILSKYVEVFSSGVFLGTGINSYISGDASLFNLITGDFAGVTTGSYQSVLSNFYNFRSQGHEDGLFLRKNEADPIDFGNYFLGARVTYDRTKAEEMHTYTIVFNQEDWVDSDGASASYIIQESAVPGAQFTDYARLYISNEHFSYSFDLVGVSL